VKENGLSAEPVRLWNRNFVLLWQGSLVSMVGDRLYEIALGFWILAVTGSTGLMGTLLAVSMIPRVLLAPFAGVAADRFRRRRLIVGMDLIRGAAAAAAGAAALAGVLEVWMVFAVGIVLGGCGAFFNPAVGSVFPDLVPRSRLEKANSAFAMVQAGSRIAGSSLGGVLYSILGAPLMFLINGISYLLSGISETFIEVPEHGAERRNLTFFQDMGEGYRFVWSNKGILTLLIVGSVLNFFASIGFLLLLPLFDANPALGPARYGVFMAVSAAGSMLGMVFLSMFRITPKTRYAWFMGTLLSFTFLFVLIPLVQVYPVMLAVGLVTGFGNAIVNILLETVMQLTIPPDKRGKVFSLLNMLLTGLMPLAMAAGGWLGEILPLKLIIAVSMILCGVPGLFLLGNREFREFISIDPSLSG
jgi:MFS transporter, DHA3 family, macrolide efflux protein